MNDDELGRRVKMMLIDQGDPRYISAGVTGGGESGSGGQDLRQMVNEIRETLKLMLSRLDTNMPWLTKETSQDGGK